MHFLKVKIYQIYLILSLENDDDDEIPIASNEELANLVNDKANPLDYKEPSTVEQISF